MFEFPTEMIVVEVEVVTLNGFQSILIKTWKKFAQNIFFQQQSFATMQQTSKMK